VLPLDPAHLECASLDAPDVRMPTKVGGKITPPRKTRDVRPEYPEALRQASVQGQVMLEGVIGRSGCITSLRVIRGVDPPMDFAALRAASGWRFTPTLLDGRAVPVIMTITVNFSLK
jgi:protein TonB